MSLRKQTKEVGTSSQQRLAKEPKLGFFFLLICLIALLIIPGYFDRPLMGGMVVDVILAMVLLSGLYLVVYRLKELLVGILLATPLLLTGWWDSLLPAPWDVFIANTLYVIFLSYIGVLIARFLFESDSVSLDMILASICLYLQVGLIWTFIYQLIEVSHPGAFKFVAIETTQMEAVHYMRRQFIYYSYVTLSTLGYGDITPVTRVARSWAVLETIVGQFYLAVVIARLVGLHISQKPK